MKRPTTKRGWLGLGCGTVLVLVVLCGVLGAVAGGTGTTAQQVAPVASGPTAAPAATDAPAATEAPVATDSPTEVPTTVELTALPPTAEPTAVPATPDVAATTELVATREAALALTAEAVSAAPDVSLGITRAALREQYEQIGFRFKESPLADGRERVMASHDIANVEIIGPADSVQQASVMVSLTAGDETQATRGLVYMGMLINAVAPGSDIGPWVVEQIKAATPVLKSGQPYAAEEQVGERRAHFQAFGASDGVLMTLTIGD